MARRRVPPTALPPDMNRARLRGLLLRFYDRDSDFGAALERLIPLAAVADITRRLPASRSPAELWALAAQPIDQWPPGDRPPLAVETVAFLQAVDVLTATYGLDRLGNAGRDQVIAWCERYLRASASGSPHPSTYGPGRLSTASVGFAVEPDLTGTIRAPWVIEAWDPSRERRASASRRLMRRARDHIQAELGRIELNAIDAGLVVLTSPRNQERDLGWLYEKVRFDRPFQAIYNALKPPPKGGVDTVRKAVMRMADKVGVDHRGWETGWR